MFDRQVPGACRRSEVKDLPTITEHKSVDPIDWPRCGQCSLPVEDFYVLVDESSGQRQSLIKLVALCHGEKEVVEVPEETLEDMRPESLMLGTAFNSEEEVERLCLKT